MNNFELHSPSFSPFNYYLLPPFIARQSEETSVYFIAFPRSQAFQWRNGSFTLFRTSSSSTQLLGTWFVSKLTLVVTKTHTNHWTPDSRGANMCVCVNLAHLEIYIGEKILSQWIQWVRLNFQTNPPSRPPTPWRDSRPHSERHPAVPMFFLSDQLPILSGLVWGNNREHVQLEVELKPLYYCNYWERMHMFPPIREQSTAQEFRPWSINVVLQKTLHQNPDADHVKKTYVKASRIKCRCGLWSVKCEIRSVKCGV